MNRLLALFALLLVAATPALASGDGEDLDALHHTSDGYYVDFSPFGKWELPRLFVVRRANGALGFDTFGSTAAAVMSGRYTAEAETHGAAPAAEGAHAAPTDGHGAAGQPEASDAEHDAAVPSGQELERAALDPTGTHGPDAVHGAETPAQLVESGKHLDAHLVPADGGSVVLDLSMTRHLLFMLLGSLLLVLWATRMAARYRAGVGRTSAPRGRLQNAFEMLVQFVRTEIAQPNIGAKADKFVPYLLTAFFFILILNFLGLIPFGATATANIAVTTVLALFTFFITQIFASKDHWAHIFNPPGVPGFVKPILVPVEILGLFTKPFALAIRLFANMTAGHLVILNLIGLIFVFAKLFGTAGGVGVAPVSVGMALFIYGLEMMVAFLQAYVFTMLSAIFIGMAVAEHDHAHEGDHHDHAHGARPEPHAAGDVAEHDGSMALTA